MTDAPGSPALLSAPGAGEPATTKDEFLAKLAAAANNLMTLKVATLVSTFQVTLDGNGLLESVVVTNDPKPKGIVTTTNVIAGDVTTIVDPDLSDADRERLEAFHGAQLDKAAKVLPANLTALANIAGDVLDLIFKTPRA